ncbi:hypothetical protein AWC25_19930 [Mycobacterium sherrisii]|uniref:Uncharacterized protein n=1 Tax=Mycobacterium sherrisii TaxID=243061 RepID=A0A1E3SFI7_9MYCO|nr:hypothetical protein [Mycobacterium sherrisii]ODR00855.1 hypothetical protein BHQ21_24040 [Mycobacterium sherrisii]ORW87033.1 hypothetical protein AWC25_19930 [Mycobacterium sherrisii]
MLGVHDVGVLDLVDVDAVEERLIADAAQRVVQAHVDRVSVAGQGQAVLQVSLRLVVLDLRGVDAGVEEGDAPRDAVLFLFEQVERHGPRVVGVQEASSFVAELVAFGGEGAPLLLRGDVEVIELAGEHVPEGDDNVLGYLDLPVVVLDLLLDVDHAHRLPGAARPLGMPTRADEVRVDDPGPVLGVGDHEA